VSARHALGDVGVPVEAGFLFSAAELKEGRLGQQGKAVVFGLGWNTQYDLCVACADGTVHASHRAVPEITFVNTDALRFIEFLLHMTTMRQRWDQAADGSVAPPEYLNALDRTLVTLRELDPGAMANGAWWNGIVDDFRLI
jgi:hypothetical protein